MTIRINKVVYTGTIFIILVVIVSSGANVVSYVNTTDSNPLSNSQGTVEVNNSSIRTGQLHLRKENFGADEFVLQNAEATIELGSVKTSANVIFKIRIPELSYVHSNIYVVTPADEGKTLRFKISGAEIDPERVNDQSYTGHLLLVKRTENSSVILANQTVSIQVTDRDGH